MKNRLIGLFSVFAILFGGMYSRLLYLSGQKPLAQAAKAQSGYTVTVYEARANIYDCNMIKLVNRDTQIKAAVLPSAENLGAVTKETNEDVLQYYSQGRPFLISVDKEIQAEGVNCYQAVKRYRDKQTAAHIIGYVDASGKGVSGIELAYDDFLKKNGESVSVRYIVNGAGRQLSGVKPQVIKTGNGQGGVVLTIDAALQRIVESVGSKYIKKGAIVIMDPYTGDIKAMASFPTFSQNNLGESVKDTQNTPMINRVLSAYAVGSSFKIVTAALAIEEGLDQMWYYCSGKKNVNGQVFKCHKLEGHGMLSLKQAMAKSCNTYFITLGLKLNRQKLLSSASDFSFGKSFKLAEGMTSAAGTLPSLDDLNNSAEVSNLSFGQGKLTATPIQVTLMLSSIINGGKLVFPRLVEGTTTDGKTIERTKQKAGLYIIKPETAKKVKSFLDYDVMDNENQYALPLTVSAGGKTATAQTGRIKNGEEILNTWFTGYFPAENPKYAVTVLNEEGETGNISASPIFQKIADMVTAMEKGEETD